MYQKFGFPCRVYKTLTLGNMRTFLQNIRKMVKLSESPDLRGGLIMEIPLVGIDNALKTMNSDRLQ